MCTHSVYCQSSSPNHHVGHQGVVAIFETNSHTIRYWNSSKDEWKSKQTLAWPVYTAINLTQ